MGTLTIKADSGTYTASKQITITEASIQRCGLDLRLPTVPSVELGTAGTNYDWQKVTVLTSGREFGG